MQNRKRNQHLETVAEKHNELQAIPEVLDSLDLSGAIISTDAMGTQTNIAEQIIQSEGDHMYFQMLNQCVSTISCTLAQNITIVIWYYL